MALKAVAVKVSLSFLKEHNHSHKALCFEVIIKADLIPDLISCLCCYHGYTSS